MVFLRVHLITQWKIILHLSRLVTGSVYRSLINLFFSFFLLFFNISLIISDIFFFHTTFSTSNNTKCCTNAVAVQADGSTVCGHHCVFYLIHRCAGHAMTDVTRILEDPAEATTIVQNFVLLLVENVENVV